MRIKQYEIWIADLNPRSGTQPGKARPVLVVQTSLLNRIPYPSTIICPLTNQVQSKTELLRIAHYVQHKFHLLWRFHLIHHSDMWIDTTSANRHHPGESVVRFIFTTIGVLIVGIPMWLVFLCQSLSVMFSQFNHANISIPKKLDDLLSLVIVSPDMHKVHHHYKLPYTDSNYGNIFSVWDRLFGTFSKLRRDEIIYGIGTRPEPAEHNRIGNLLKMPFYFYRKRSC